MFQTLCDGLFGKRQPDQAQEQSQGSVATYRDITQTNNSTSSTPTSQNSPGQKMSTNFLNSANVTGNISIGDVSTGNTKTTTYNYGGSSSDGRSSISMEHEAEELRNKLIKKYAGLIANQRLKKKKFDEYNFRFEVCDSKEKFEINQIFDAGKRILIESSQKGGKSMLANKIANDWALGKNYTKKFKFVFLISYDGENLNEMVLDEVKEIASDAEYENSQIVKSIIDRFSNEVLLIFDDFDDLSKQRQENIVREFGDSTVVVMCDVGKYKLTDDQKTSKAMPAFYDKAVAILAR